MNTNAIIKVMNIGGSYYHPQCVIFPNICPKLKSNTFCIEIVGQNIHAKLILKSGIPKMDDKEFSSQV